MIRKYSFSIVIALCMLVINTCSNSGHTPKDMILYADIVDNTTLLHLKEYYASVAKGIDSDLVLLINYISEFEMEIFFVLNLYELSDFKPICYSDFKNTFVFMNKVTDHIEVKDSLAASSVYSKAFEKQFEYYQENNYFPLPILYKREFWIFKESTYVGKRFD